jgi:hypothetical protein
MHSSYCKCANVEGSPCTVVAVNVHMLRAPDAHLLL